MSLPDPPVITMPIAIEPILPHIPAFVVVLARIGGLFIFAPMLSSPAIPFQIKILLLLAMSICVYPTVDLTGMHEVGFDLYALLPLMAGELLIGAVIGLMAAMPFYGVQLGGLLMGQQVGLGMAQVVNPAMDIEGDNLGQLLFLLALSLFIGMGGLEVLFGGLVYTFSAVPGGGFGIGDTPLSIMLGLLASGFNLALRLAIPVIAIIFVENAVMGFVMKTMPTLNIMSFGFPIRIVIGLMVMIVALGVMSELIIDELDQTLMVIESWIAGLFPDAANAQPGTVDDPIQSHGGM